MSPLLQVRTFGKRGASHDVWLFRGLSFETVDGAFIWISGESGSGKSTLLRCIAKLEKPDEGELHLYSTAQAEQRAKESAPYYRSQVMYVRQKSSLAGNSVEDCLAEAFGFRQQAGKSFSIQQALAWCQRLGFSEALIGKQPASLSGGEAQVVALIRALLLEPQGLLLDEPDNALDARRKKLFWQVIGGWLREGRRFVICVSHDPQPPLPAQQVIALGDDRPPPLGGPC